jgi:hypothetical protein
MGASRGVEKIYYYLIKQKQAKRNAEAISSNFQQKLDKI